MKGQCSSRNREVNAHESPMSGAGAWNACGQLGPRDNAMAFEYTEMGNGTDLMCADPTDVG